MDDPSCLVEIAAQLADRSRSAIVLYLMDGNARTASELALAANLSAPSASMHLAKLLRAGVLSVVRDGRNKYYRIASPAMAHAVEALAVAANFPLPAEHRDERLSVRMAHPWAFARTCFDHLAGRLGVELTQALQQQDCLQQKRSGYTLTEKGEKWFRDLGIDCERLASERRAFATECLDWSERRSHLGGALGAALLTGMCKLGWLKKSRLPRLVRLTLRGEEELRKRLSLVLGRRSNLKRN